MLQITSNLHFRGQCKQAVQLYKEVFGAQVKVMLSEKDVNPNADIAENNAKHRLQQQLCFTR